MKSSTKRTLFLQIDTNVCAYVDSSSMFIAVFMSIVDPAYRDCHCQGERPKTTSEQSLMEEKQQMNFTHQRVIFSAWPKLAFFYNSDNVLTLTYVNECMYSYFYGMYNSDTDFWTASQIMHEQLKFRQHFILLQVVQASLHLLPQNMVTAKQAFSLPFVILTHGNTMSTRTALMARALCIVPGPRRLAQLASWWALRGLPAAAALSFLSWLIQLYHSRSSPGRESWYPGPQLSINYMARRGSFSTGVNCIRAACCTSPELWFWLICGPVEGSAARRRRAKIGDFAGLTRQILNSGY